MEFRRSGGRDERRRRVLMEETSSAAGSAADSSTPLADAAPSAVLPSRAYADAAKSIKQKRLTDLIPRKSWFVALLAFLAMLAAGAIVAAAWYAPEWQWLAADGQAMLAANARGNLASWFASLVMLLSAAGAMQIYLLRRHKIDDYRGRYRLWLWVATALLLASADAVIGLHQVCGTLLTTLLPEAWRPGLHVAALAPLAILAGAMGVRLAVETRQSYGTLAAMLLAALAYASSATLSVRPELLTLAGETNARAPLVASLGCQLAGHVMLLLSIVLYSRYVLLVANGLVAIRTPRPRKQKARKQAAKPAGDDAETATPKQSRRANAREAKRAARTAEEPAPKPAAPKASISKATASSPTPPQSKESAAPKTLSLEELAKRDELAPSDTAHLSKAERRRLRKLQRRSRAA